jgi:hypothetical protein
MAATPLLWILVVQKVQMQVGLWETFWAIGAETR